MEGISESTWHIVCTELMLVVLGAVKEYKIVLWLKREFLIFQMMDVPGCFFFPSSCKQAHSYKPLVGSVMQEN